MNHTFIVGEIGHNFMGNMNIAKKLIDCAVGAGFDAVKFQAYKTDFEFMKTHKMLDVMPDLEWSSTLNELSTEQFAELKEYCGNAGIVFFGSVFDMGGLQKMIDVDSPIIKIPSGMIVNEPLIQAAAKTGKDIMLSSGMATMAEVHRAIEITKQAGIDKEQITVLQCTSAYPPDMCDINLDVICNMRIDLAVGKIGLSDHALELEVPIAAVTLGAQVIERHITLSRKTPGPDHHISMEPDDMVKLVKAIRNTEKLRGDWNKRPLPYEEKYFRWRTEVKLPPNPNAVYAKQQIM